MASHPSGTPTPNWLSSVQLHINEILIFHPIMWFDWGMILVLPLPLRSSACSEKLSRRKLPLYQVRSWSGGRSQEGGMRLHVLIHHDQQCRVTPRHPPTRCNSPHFYPNLIFLIVCDCTGQPGARPLHSSLCIVHAASLQCTCDNYGEEWCP